MGLNILLVKISMALCVIDDEIKDLYGVDNLTDEILVEVSKKFLPYVDDDKNLKGIILDNYKEVLGVS